MLEVHPCRIGHVEVPAETLTWLLGEDNPAVSVLTRRWLLGKTDDSGAAKALWARRNDYAPVAQILGESARRRIVGTSRPRLPEVLAARCGRSTSSASCGQMGHDERVQRAADLRLQSAARLTAHGAPRTSARSGSIPCLTANVGRALARLGYEHDERTVAALRYCVDLVRDVGVVNCRQAQGFQLNGYCHMLAPKLLLFLAEIPRDLWPDGAEELRDDCVEKLREKSVLRCLPAEARHSTSSSEP